MKKDPEFTPIDPSTLAGLIVDDDDEEGAEIEEQPVRVNLKRRSLVSVDDLSMAEIDHIFAVAKACRDKFDNGGFGVLKPLNGKVITCLFYEASTRTSSSFIAAATKLGAGVIPITQGVQYSSVSKGETLHDTVRTLAQYSDVIVLRHPDEGSAAEAALAAAIDHVPLINAGDGIGQHPSQALLDLFTIQQKFGDLNGKRIGVVGDLKNGRTVHSLLKLLARFKDITVYMVSPDSLKLPDAFAKGVGKSLALKTAKSISDIIGEVDVLYVTRVQKERSGDKSGKIETVDAALLKDARASMILMHPLPRTEEMSKSVDQDKRSVHFDQVKNGLWVRMALLLCAVGAEWELL